MNNKGEMNQIGVLIVIFITVIVGLALLLSIADGVGESTSLGTAVNETVTLAANGGVTDLTGKHVTSMVLLNWTTNVTILDGNYTILNNQINSAGELTAQIQTDTVQFQGNASRASYTYQPTGYIPSAGGRSITTIIILLTALAIAVVAMAPVFKGPLKDMIGR